jgi:hypothetical protein
MSLIVLYEEIETVTGIQVTSKANRKIVQTTKVDYFDV